MFQIINVLFKKCMFLLFMLVFQYNSIYSNTINNNHKHFSNSAILFINLSSCVNCNYTLYNQILKTTREMGLQTQIYITDLNQKQYEKGINVARNIFTDTLITINIDESNKLSKSFVTSSNELIIVSNNDTSRFNLSKNEDIAKFNKQFKNKKLNNKETRKTIKIDFEDYILLYDKDYFLHPNMEQLIFHDKVSESYIFIDIKNGKYIKEINYSNLRNHFYENMHYTSNGEQKNSLDDFHENIRHYFFVRIFFDELGNELFLSHIIKNFYFKHDQSGGNFKELPNYVYALFNQDFQIINMIETKDLDYSVRSRPFYITEGRYVLECYDKKYHHTEHNESKDVSHFLCLFDFQTLTPIGISLGEIEKLNSTIYSYTFLNYFSYDTENKKLFLLNPFNSLFASYDTKNINFTNINIFEPDGKLKYAFDYYRTLNKIEVYEGNTNINIVNGYPKSFSCMNGFCYILLSEYDNDNFTIGYFLQTYDEQGNFISEKEFFSDLDISQLSYLSILGINKSNIILLSKWKNDEYVIYKIPTDDL